MIYIAITDLCAMWNVCCLSVRQWTSLEPQQKRNQHRGTVWSDWKLSTCWSRKGVFKHYQLSSIFEWCLLYINPSLLKMTPTDLVEIWREMRANTRFTMLIMNCIPVILGLYVLNYVSLSVDAFMLNIADRKNRDSRFQASELSSPSSMDTYHRLDIAWFDT